MRGILWSTIVLSLAGVALGQGTGPNGAKVTRIIESREWNLEKSTFSGWKNGIDVTLHIDGPGVVGARKYGNLKTTRAVDDVGTDLTTKGEGPAFDGAGFEEIREQQEMSFGSGRQKEPKPKPTGFDVELKLPTPAARTAKTITLTGSLDVLVGGEKKIVEVTPIKQNFGKEVNDPALKGLGVTFKLIDPAQPGSGPGAFFRSREKDKSVSAQISGNIPAIASVSIVDKTGKKLNQGSGWSDDGGVRAITYDLEQPLPDDAKLQIEIWPGQKTVTVPFELKDVRLP